jgi:hypothetical protein
MWIKAYGVSTNKKNGCPSSMDEELKAGIENAEFFLNS